MKHLAELPCLNCNKENSHLNSRFCSDACSKKHHAKKTECKTCGQSMLAYPKGFPIIRPRLFCSNKCRVIFSKMRFKKYETESYFYRGLNGYTRKALIDEEVCREVKNR